MEVPVQLLVSEAAVEATPAAFAAARLVAAAPPLAVVVMVPSAMPVPSRS